MRVMYAGASCVLGWNVHSSICLCSSASRTTSVTRSLSFMCCRTRAKYDSGSDATLRRELTPGTVLIAGLNVSPASDSCAAAARLSSSIRLCRCESPALSSQTERDLRCFAAALICGWKVHSPASCEGGEFSPVRDDWRIFSTDCATRSRNGRRVSSLPVETRGALGGLGAYPDSICSASRCCASNFLCACCCCRSRKSSKPLAWLASLPATLVSTLVAAEPCRDAILSLGAEAERVKVQGEGEAGTAEGWRERRWCADSPR
mmetsp:Transcript_22508/g.55955  ORF Transcript_22508/g.55955 Transcript_22508/m.55955 type:complete len:262 (+) Transcript_22508:394-1179(+)